MVSELEKSKQQKLTQLGTRVNLKAMNLAASWYIAMPSKDLGKKPKAIELFGQPLVAWRDQTGYPVILERYCSHMGASLAIGKVVNGCIQCPYHHWHYDGSGQCVSIPEVERIPPMARQVTYVTAERYGYIWVWYGSQTHFFPLPEFPAAEEQMHNYMPLRYTYDTKTTVWRLVESGGVDYYHAVALHKQKIAGSVQLTLLDDQHSARQSEPPIQKEGWFKVLMEFPVEKYLVGPFSQVLGLSAETFSFQTDIWPSGYRITGFADNEETFRVLLGTTPVTENRTIGHYLMMLKKTGKFWLDIPSYMLYAWYNKIISAEDMSVFNTQNADVSRAYVKHDRGVLKYREFYQRWVDKVE